MKLISDEVPVVTGEGALLIVNSGESAHDDVIRKIDVPRDEWPEFQPDPRHKRRMNALARLKERIVNWTDVD